MLARYKLDGCDSPGGLAYAPAAGVLIAACDGKDGLGRRRGQRQDGRQAGDRRRAGCGDLRSDAKTGVCPGRRERNPDGDLAAAKLGKVAVVQTPQKTMASGARTGAVDPGKTGKLYLPAAKMQAPSRGPRAGGRPTAVPGSFEFVVVGP